MYDVLIIGGGASGLLTAISIGKSKNVAILERNNNLGKKLFATGNGHCNILNSKALHAKEVRDALFNLGIVGQEDEAGRIYPISRESASVVDALVSNVKKQNVEIICDTHITDVLKVKDGFKLLSKDGKVYTTKKLVIATGGKAGIQYGCYGEGYRWVQSFGHSLKKPIPALVGLEAEEDISILHGVRTMANVSIYSNETLLASEYGEVQFTKDCISGICVMNLSRFIRFEGDKKFKLSIDLFPNMQEESLKSLLEHQSKTLGDELSVIVPNKLGSYVKQKASNNFSNTLKNLTFSIRGTKGWDSAQVTSGGVPMGELNDAYESRIVDGLYIVGEMVDYDGPCGGYNLCNAFWSGIQAGKDIARFGLD